MKSGEIYLIKGNNNSLKPVLIVDVKENEIIVESLTLKSKI